jgi:nitroreductase/NAD-dependent dihydropyrimidine dehydrogenase PreA subunit
MSTAISVDAKLCNRCGCCVAECPVGAMQPQADVGPHVDAERCIGCGHCGAVCSLGAVISEDGSFPEWQMPAINPESAKAFLAGRRSVRRYRSLPLDRAILAEVLSIGPYASTASNAQDVRARVLTGESVFELAGLVNDYYCWFDGLLQRRWLWPLLWFTAARPYIRDPRKLIAVRERLRRFDREHNWLFFNAPAVVVLTAPRKNTHFGRVNCVIAAERMMQYATALGLGSCMIGFAEVAMRRRKSIAQSIGVSAAEEPHVLFTLGYPAVQYRRLPARRAMPVEWGFGRQ